MKKGPRSSHSPLIFSPTKQATKIEMPSSNKNGFTFASNCTSNSKIQLFLMVNFDELQKQVTQIYFKNDKNIKKSYGIRLIVHTIQYFVFSSGTEGHWCDMMILALHDIALKGGIPNWGRSIIQEFL